MAIQWFPGHMHKARKEMAQVLPQTDVIIEVLDARIPFSSENPMLEQMRKNKPCLKVLTKKDLANPAVTDQWLEHLSGAEVLSTAISASDPATIQQIPQLIASMVNKTQSRIKPFVAMVVGIPNVGKSTLINLLAGRTVAKTGNEPAITKRQQHISLPGNWILRDTPGVLWPNVENPASGYRLAATGAIRDTAMDSADVASHLLDYLCPHYPKELTQRFKADLPLDDSIATLEKIGLSRGCIGAGKQVDYDRAARLLLTEFRAGKIGPISLETPEMKTSELLALAKLLEKKRLSQEQKKEKRKKKKEKRKKP